MAIPEGIKTNFQTLIKAFENGDIALLECLNRESGEPAFAICAVNRHSKSSGKPEFEMVPFGLMFNGDPYQILIPPGDPQFDERLKKS
jgi:hypothetical protein